MKVESSLVVEIWGQFVDLIPQGRRADAAISFIRTLEDYGMDHRDLADIVDEDTHLARAYLTVFEDELNEGVGDDGAGDDE